MMRKIEHVCKQCGKCCRVFRITFDEADINREPRLLKIAMTEDQVRKDKTARVMKQLKHPYAMAKVYPGAPCVFLNKENKCVIYETRPQICRDYPGDDYCLREIHGYSKSKH